jgi:hypothetical protein
VDQFTGTRSTLPLADVEFAVDIVLAVAEGAVPPSEFEFEESYIEQSADRVAARALPLLLLPNAESILSALGGEGSIPRSVTRIMEAGCKLARAIANETRLHLARGLDPVWNAPCRSGRCHHELALVLAVESMRDCVLGGWDPNTQRRPVLLVDDPVAGSVTEIDADDLDVSRLDAAIRATGAAAGRDLCVRKQAKDLLMVLLAAQQRGLLAHNQYDERGSHALVAARSLIGVAATGDDQPLHEYIESYADNGRLLGSFLRALAAVAEETPTAAQATRRVWPDVMAQVFGFIECGHRPFSDNYLGQAALASLIPTPTYDGAFLHREVESEPLTWTDPIAWRETIEAWLAIAAGRPQCVDALIGLVHTMPGARQAQIGLPWVAAIVLAEVAAVTRRSYLIAGWLIEVRPYAIDVGVLDTWQALVDALVVAGNSDLAPYSE